MKMLKMLFAAAAAVTMTFTAQAEKTAKAVLENDGKTLKFVYDDTNYGTKGTGWFSVAEAEAIDPYNEDVPWYDCGEIVTKVVFDPSFAAYRPKQCGSWFYDFGVLAAVDGLTNLDTSVATNMAYMFSNCPTLTTLDVTGFDTANVTDMDYMFQDCLSLTTLNLASFDTANVTSMHSMFYGCSSLTTLNLASFDTAKVTDMDYMFQDCSSLEAICASDRFVTDQVSDSSSMFKNCSKLVGGAETVYDNTKTDKAYARIDGGPLAPGYFTRAMTAKVVVADGGTTLRFVYDGNDYGTNWFSVAEAEAIDPHHEDVPWYGKRSAVTKVVFDPSFAAYRPKKCDSWFYDFGVLAAVEGLTNLDTSVATSMAYMFSYCRALKSLDVSGFDTSKVTSMAYMFSGCSSLEAICASDRFVTDQVSDSSSMFKNCSKLVGDAGTAYDSTKTDKTYARIDGGPLAPGYFTRAKTAKAVVEDEDDGKTLKFVYDDTNYGTKDVDWFSVAEAEAIDSYVQNVSWCDCGATVTKVVFDSSFAAYRPKQCGCWFSGFGVLAAVDGLKNLNTSVTTNMYSMFSGCSSLTTLNLASFDTAKVTDMSFMFEDCSSLTTLDVSGFDTSNVTDMDFMFSGCSTLTTLDVTGFDTANVTGMGGMFVFCSSLTSLDVTGFGTANVTDMNGMFAACSSLTSLDLTGFDTANVTDMYSMFAFCSSLTTLDLTGFDTANVTDMETMFCECSSLTTICVSDRFVTDQVSDSSGMFQSCSKLVGGAGTAYNFIMTDATYARIDGGPSAPGYFTRATIAGGYAAWAAEKGLTGANAAWDAKPALWGGKWENGFIYTFGEGLADGTLAIMNISFDADGEPVITTTPVVEGHTDFTPAVIGTPNLQNWTSPVVLENKSGNDWTLPAGKKANFFRVRLSE